MGYDFGTSRQVKARRDHSCEQCGKKIETGTQHVYAVGVYEGDFYATRLHVECDAAASEYAKLHSLWGDEYPWFQHDDTSSEPDDRKWMKEKHPVVYDRLGWAGLDALYDEMEAEETP